MSACKEFQMYINDMIDSTASDEIRDSFIEHIDKCAACRRKYEIAMQIRQVLIMRAPEPDADFTSDVMRAVRRLSRRQSQPDITRRRYRLRNVFICACALLIAVISVVFAYFSDIGKTLQNDEVTALKSACRIIAAEESDDYVRDEFFDEINFSSDPINSVSLLSALTDNGFEIGQGPYAYIALVKLKDTDIINRNYNISYIRSSNTGSYSFYVCSGTYETLVAELEDADELCIFRSDSTGPGLVVAAPADNEA